MGNKGHSFPVDWWTLGILTYEMLHGYPPFFDDDPMDSYKKVLEGKVKFSQSCPSSAKLLIKNLLHTDTSKRLGASHGANEVGRSEFFSGLYWQTLLNLEVPNNCQPLDAASLTPQGGFADPDPSEYHDSQEAFSNWGPILDSKDAGDASFEVSVGNIVGNESNVVESNEANPACADEANPAYADEVNPAYTDRAPMF